MNKYIHLRMIEKKLNKELPFYANQRVDQASVVSVNK